MRGAAPDEGDGFEIFLAGAGSFAVEIADWARAAGLRVGGLIDLHDGERTGTMLDGLPVLARDTPGEGRSLALAAGGERSAHWRLIGESGWVPRALVHPRASVAASARVEPGAVIGPAAVIGAATAIGMHSLISRGTLVGHHVEVESFVSLLPGANVASGVRLGEGAVLGMGSVVVDHTTIGSAAVVAAGAVVLGDVAPGTRVQGVPARVFAG